LTWRTTGILWYQRIQSVGLVVAECRVGKEAGLPLSIGGFLRVQVGEGLERSEAKDFAAEVQQLAQQQ
jgi:translation elongation factor EF-Ts